MPDWSRIRWKLIVRSGGLCEVSGQPLDRDTFDVHHRRNKGMGGTSRTDVHDLDNLLALAPFVHNLSPGSVHGNPAWSRPRGYLLRKGTQYPGMVPVWLLGQRWVLLGKDGKYHRLPGDQPPAPV